MSHRSRTLTFLSLFALSAVSVACEEPGATKAKDAAPKGDAPSVAVHVINPEGKLVGPIKMPVVRKAADEWAKLLDQEAFRILRRSGTERPGCGTLLDNKREGIYACAGCGLPLFSSDSKFVSGTGWPSFFRPVAKSNIEEVEDNAHGMRRVEIRCARCEGHLGHVFRDGPAPTGLRYCLNSASMGFTDSANVKSLADPYFKINPNAATPERAEVILAGGCFWCVEAVFEELVGVHEAVSGYAGGDKEAALYPLVSRGLTKHAEAVRIAYDPTKISYETLLEVHFATHDPTTVDRQGADRGAHYRSAIFYKNEAEKKAAQAVIARLQSKTGLTFVTKLEPFTGFYEAEPKHQDYVCNNPASGYVRGVAMPKVEKVRSKFKDRIKKEAPQSDPGVPDPAVPESSGPESSGPDSMGGDASPAPDQPKTEPAIPE